MFKYTKQCLNIQRFRNKIKWRKNFLKMYLEEYWIFKKIFKSLLEKKLLRMSVFHEILSCLCFSALNHEVGTSKQGILLFNSSLEATQALRILQQQYEISYFYQ